MESEIGAEQGCLVIFFYLLITVMLLPRHPLWAKFVGELTVIKYVGGACLLYAVFHLFVRRSSPHFMRTWQARWFVVLFLLATASFLTKGAHQGPLATSPFLSYVSFVLLFFITLVVVDSLQRLRWVLLMSLGSIGLASVYLLREWQKYHHLYESFRPGWVAGDPNYFTVSALLCLPVGFFLLLGRQPWWERLFCLGCLAVTLAAITLAGSRGGVLGLGVLTLFAVWHLRRRIHKLLFPVLVLFVLMLVAPVSPLNRFLRPSSSDQGSADTRIVLWEAGLGMMRNNLAFGVGLGNFKGTVGDYGEYPGEPGARLNNIAHNSYVEIGAELGLPGLLAFVAILVWSFLGLERVRRRTKPRGPLLLQQAALGMQAGLLAFGVTIFFVSGHYQKLYWLMVFLSMCLSSLEVIAREESTRRGSVQPIPALPLQPRWALDSRLPSARMRSDAVNPSASQRSALRGKDASQ